MGLSNLREPAVHSTGLRFITSAPVSGSTSFSVENCFSSAFQTYLIVRNFSTAAADTIINVRLRTSLGADSATGYRYQWIAYSSTSASAGRGLTQTAWDAGLSYSESTVCGTALLWVKDPFEAVNTTGWGVQTNFTSNLTAIQDLFYSHDTLASYTGFTVICASAMTGSVEVYGLRET